MTQTEALQAKFKQLILATQELRDVADANGVCPHCLIHEIIDTQDIPQEVQDSVKNLYNIAESKRKELIDMLCRFEPSLSV